MEKCEGESRIPRVTYLDTEFLYSCYICRMLVYLSMFLKIFYFANMKDDIVRTFKTNTGEQERFYVDYSTIYGIMYS